MCEPTLPQFVICECGWMIYFVRELSFKIYIQASVQFKNVVWSDYISNLKSCKTKLYCWSCSIA
jgi:hypothetical protein